MHRIQRSLCLLCLFAGVSASADLSGNWVASQDMHDGTYRRTYLNLRQQGDKISGTIRATQFFYTIVERTGGPEGFTITGRMMDGDTERRVQYQGKLTGDELHVATRRRADAPLTEMVAHRAPAEEGAMPARIEPPQLHKVPDNGLVRTPPMGWNSWNKFAGRVTSDDVRSMADAIASNGMKEAGYIYINIDDTWQGERDANGNIQANRKIPNMKALADYVHGKGLKLGIYSSPGPNTCAGYEGSYGHEEQDARTYAAWGIDYLKYDWCGARNIYTDSEMQPVYQKMGDALRAAGRPIVYSLCQYGRAGVWKWGADVGGNLWRTTGDIRDTWDSMTRIGFGQSDLAAFAAPGHWNDPDMLEIGNGGMNEDEYRTHMSFWSILAAPLLAGNDLRSMTPAIRDILTNREVIAIDQDARGKQGSRISKTGEQEVWTRPLSGGGLAIALFNRGTSEARITVKWSALGIQGSPHIRNLWTHADVPPTRDGYAATVPAHGVVLLRADAPPLPGQGLAQHPFLYCGEWQNRSTSNQTMYIVRGGKVVWSYTNPLKVELGDCSMLAGGNILFSRQFGASEITPQKKIVWNYDGPSGVEIHTAWPVDKDRVLIMQNGNPAKLLVIRKRDNHVEKEMPLPVRVATGTHGQFRHIRMTPQGNFLIAHMDLGKVVEYDPSGKEVWSVAAPSAWAAVRLKNGNTLISGNQHGYVREVNPEGETVWEINKDDLPGIPLYTVQEVSRLANGNTLINNWPGGLALAEWPAMVQLIEVTPQKKVVWGLRDWKTLGPASSTQLLDEPGVAERHGLQR